MAPKSRMVDLRETINAPKDKVFSMLVNGENLMRWFPTIAEADPVVGGHYLFTFEYLDPSVAGKRNHTHSGKYLEITPNEKVVFTWDPNRDGLTETQVAFSLNEKDGKTEVHIEHTGWGEGEEAAKSIEGHTQGWTLFLQNLKSVLEQGRDARYTEMGMKVSKQPISA